MVKMMNGGRFYFDGRNEDRGLSVCLIQASYSGQCVDGGAGGVQDRLKRGLLLDNSFSS